MKWNQSLLDQGPFIKLSIGFYLTNTMLSFVGVLLIYWANRKIALSTENITSNREPPVHTPHPGAEPFLRRLSLPLFFQFSTRVAFIRNLNEVVLNVILCYIVWQQACSKQLEHYDCFIEQQADGTSQLVCRLKAQAPTQLDTTFDSDEDSI